MKGGDVPGLDDYIRYRQAKSKEAYDNACLLVAGFDGLETKGRLRGYV